ncbi:MAG: deoxyribose-phosphate aldolase [Treponema sp.]|nr:deoxyribose-phosphate aldolase [Treponema sp.]
MKKNQLANIIDHTNLNPCATEADIEKLCNEAIKYNFASVCVNPVYVPFCQSLLKDSDVKVCTVVGFPLGANSIDDKASQAAITVSEGADEVDMVINLGLVKEKKWDDIYEEIYAVRCAIDDVELDEAYKVVLKVILETCYLSDDEIVECCKVAENAGADFVKTSTGFAIIKDSEGKLLPNGATVHAVQLMRKSVSANIGVKASGGIGDYEKAIEMVNAGANRIGASAGVKIVS